MSYAPPAYPPGYAPQPLGDPTQVMGRRIGAFLIDGLIAFIAFVVVVAIVQPTHVTDAPGGYCDVVRDVGSRFCVEANGDAYVATNADAVAIGLVPFLVGAANGVFVQAFAGGTVGKLLVGLRVVREDGREAGFGRVLARYAMLLLAFVASALFFLGVIVELIVALATKPHRRVGDMVAGTFVVGKADVGRPVRSQPAWGQPAWGQPAWGPPPQWGPPPGQPGWGSPPSHPGWGAPAPGQPGWGSPAPQPAPQPGWGSPAPTPTPEPAPQPGWGAPTPAHDAHAGPSPAPAGATASVESAAADAAASTSSTHPPPQWDLQLKAWTVWDPPRGQWLQWDDAAQEWRPMGR